MSNERKQIEFWEVQMALAQVHKINTELYKQGIFNFYENREYLGALHNYEVLYDIYEEQTYGGNK